MKALMKFIDTHAHLQFEKFNSDRTEVIKRNAKKLEAIINPGADLISSKNAVDLADKVTNFYAAVGVHPHHTENWTSDYLPHLKKLITADKVVAVGEIGLDNHHYQLHSEPDLTKQKKILLPQIELAISYKKPILFHCRKAYDELYQTIKKYKPISGLVHCFMGDKATAKKFVDLGLLISFAGNLTYRGNEVMRETAKYLSANQILLETDSPYLTPEPQRGQRNEPINLILTAKVMAQIRQVSLPDVANFTTNNAKTLFGI